MEFLGSCDSKCLGVVVFMMQDAIDFLLNLELHVLWMVMIIFLLSVIHPMISQPWSLLSVTVASIWFGIPLALIILLIKYNYKLIKMEI